MDLAGTRPWKSESLLAVLLALALPLIGQTAAKLDSLFCFLFVCSSILYHFDLELD